MKKILGLLAISTAAFSQQQFIQQKNGPTLGFDQAKIIQKDGLSFKDLNKNGRLDVYEDWRKPVDERAKDLAKQ